MWATPGRYQATTIGRLRSLSWLQCKDSKNTGWLANTCDNELVGISWVDGTSDSCSELKERGNLGLARNACVYKSCFNLKGHSKEVLFARFSPQGDKLATYDSSGQALLWTNSANLYVLSCTITVEQKVRDLQWSPCGTYIAVCGDKMEILSGIDFQSLHVRSTDPFIYCISCAWNECSTQLALNTFGGKVVVFDPNYDVDQASSNFNNDVPIKCLQYYGPVQEIRVSSKQGPKISIESQALSAYLINGVVIFNMKVRLSHCHTVRVQTHLVKGLVEWNTSKTILAVVGSHHDSPQILSAKFFNQKGVIVMSIDRVLRLPNLTLHSMCWGLRDSTIFLGCGDHLYSMAVQYSLPRLQDLCRQFLKTVLSNQHLTEFHIPLPEKEIEKLDRCIPNLSSAPIDVTRRDAVHRLFKPLENKKRLQCALVYSTDENQKEKYTLQYEYMGSYIPLLKADILVGIKVTVAIQAGFPVATSHETSACPAQKTATVLSSRTPQTTCRWKAFRQRFCKKQVQPLPVLATIKSSIFKSCYQFSSSFEDNTAGLGTLDIRDHPFYKPRKLVLTLTEPAVQLTTKKPHWDYQRLRYSIESRGRFNQESIHNIQFEHDDQMVFQLGKINDDDFVLDFQYPFSPVTAMCTALSSIVSYDEHEICEQR